MNKILYTTCIILMGLLSNQTTWAQNQNDNAGNILLTGVHYAFQFPGADLSDRFGNNNQIGIDIDLITKNNFIIGASGGFQFGNTVKEDVLTNLRDQNGFIIGNDMGIASLVLRRRGTQLGVYGGKIFPLSSQSRSGIRVTAGAGFLQHKIRVQDDLESVPQVAGDYKGGYDRLSNGLALQQFVGYQLMSKSRRINAYIGFEVTQAFTQNQRKYNYDTRMSDTENRFDMLYSLKIGWTILPFFLNEESAEIYY